MTLSGLRSPRPTMRSTTAATRRDGQGRRGGVPRTPLV
jgi:hypothetical protein